MASSRASLTTTSRIIIVGAGVFGLSTAFHLLRRGYTNVIVLDRARDLPAVDAASTDINKIVRSSYNDVFYTQLAREAIEAWKDPMWKGCYHESGVISVYDQNHDDTLGKNDRQLGALIEDLPDTKALRAKLLSSLNPFTDPSSHAHRIGLPTDRRGYFNPEGGWAEASRAIEILLSHIKKIGGKVIAGQEVISLVKDERGQTTGVKCRDGVCFEGDRVILTIGSWTASTFPELLLDSKCLATGQTVGMIQLSADEQGRYKDTPVFLDFHSGFYTFPPTKDGIVKLSMHLAGYTHMVSTPQVGSDNGHDLIRRISRPRTITSHPDSGDGLRVPRSALQTLRAQLRKVYPELGEKPWSGTRLCWYTDAPDGDWVIGPFPGDPTLFLATSGSGHGFKFLPNVGRLVADCIEGVLDPVTMAKFSVDRDIGRAVNKERATVETLELDPDELCGPGEAHKMIAHL